MLAVISTKTTNAKEIKIMTDNDKRKKFKDTKLGAFLLKKAPKFVSSILPESGVLGMVKGLIENDTDLSPEEKQALQNELLELYKLEVEDRNSARTRQVEVTKAGGSDAMFNVSGAVGLLVFCFLVYAIIFIEVPKSNSEIWVHLIGIVEGVALSIFGYFYGASHKRP